MEKKGGGKVRANKIKEWQKEEMQVNWFGLATLIEQLLLCSIKELTLNMTSSPNTMSHIFSKLLTTNNVRSGIEVANAVDQQQINMKPVRLTLDRNPTSVNDEAMNVTYANGAIEPKVEEKKQQINKAAEKEIQELEELLRCKVCLDCDACIVFFPCRHMVTCESCEGFLQSCPVCRSVIEEAVKINEE